MAKKNQIMMDQSEMDTITRLFWEMIRNEIIQRIRQKLVGALADAGGPSTSGRDDAAMLKVVLPMMVLLGFITGLVVFDPP
jgi:hypothetical protein